VFLILREEHALRVLSEQSTGENIWAEQSSNDMNQMGGVCSIFWGKRISIEKHNEKSPTARRMYMGDNIKKRMLNTQTGCEWDWTSSG
jgi:hypothetical protein